jgi:hypothetical protein
VNGDSLDRAIEAAAEALCAMKETKTLEEEARIAVEAAHDILCESYMPPTFIRLMDEQRKRAEAEVSDIKDQLVRGLLAERALADRLAEALRDAWSSEMDCDDYEDALAAYEAARRT